MLLSYAPLYAAEPPSGSTGPTPLEPAASGSTGATQLEPAASGSTGPTPLEPDASGPLTLEAAVAAAGRNFEGFALTDVQLERADALRRLALSSLLPRATFQGLYVHNSYETATLPKDNVSAIANLSVTLFDGPSLPAYAASKLSGEAVAAQVDRQRAVLAYQVVQAFYTALAADRQLEVREQAVRASGESLRVASQRSAAGVALPVGVARARLEEARARAAYQEARIARTRARASLAYLIGQAPTEVLVQPSVASIPDMTEEKLIETALEHRTDLKAADLNATAAALVADRSWMDYLPSLSLTGTLRGSPTGFVGSTTGTGGGVTADPVTWQVGLRLDWILYDGGAREADIRLRRASARESALDEKQLSRQVALEVHEARLQVQGFEVQRDALQHAVLAARDNFALVEAQQKAGSATPLEVADATTARTDAEVQLILGDLSRDLARLNLRLAIGVPPIDLVPR